MGSFFSFFRNWHVFLTCLYFGFWAGYYNRFSAQGGHLQPNEIGDFLAGVAGPVALFWLVIGYYQQRKELQNSSDALRLQAAELASATRQHTSLARSSLEQLNFEKQKYELSEKSRLASERGKFVVSHGSCWHNGKFVEFYVDVTNLGQAVADFSFLFPAGLIQTTSEANDNQEFAEMEYPVWERFKGRRYCFAVSKGHSGKKFDFLLTYTNADGSEHSKTFVFEFDAEGGEYMKEFGSDGFLEIS
ncbi:hypothetical protein [Leisingera sp. JC1]|uniref:hypothetical protein n=1 Tax=Leisingera sp. JC1 TaxID=1855282 RepID=UPI0008035825|nr:hypothetical protein [Leisingera sp. JC1]OBY27983.1 hypothetical protein A9D60_13185 [Leisingera sp. JC1]